MVRGRGFGRGSTMGRGGSYRGSSSSYRGSSGRNSSFGGSGGYGGSRQNYSSSSYSYDSRSKDRSFSSRDRHDDHKRSYRPSSRDRSSPDRKRSRHEDSRLSSSYSSSYRRNESSSSTRRTPPPPTSGRASSSSYRGHREDSSSHRHSATNDSMGPPKNSAPRSSRIIRPRGGAPSRSIRGSSTRGVRIIRRESSDMKIMRRKLLLARQRDRARRIKIARLTSSLRKTRDVTTHRPRKRSEKKDDESSKHGDDDEKEKIKKEDDEDADTTTEKGDDVDEVKKDGKTDDEEEEDEDTKDKDDKDDDSKTKSPKARKIKSNFIKLTCVHCRAKCLTFKEYSNHLYSRSHRVAMRRLSLRQKAQLAQMRMKQRNAQRDIEESSKDELEDCKPQFCLLCRLNYRQPKAKHQLSEAHRNMKKFLMPYCSTCHIAFKSPMMYEAHRCSLDHIKRKARNNESHSDASGDEKEVDLNNFMTVDSVGEIDGHLEEIEDKAEDEVKESKVNVGAEHVKKTEGFYCDLCRLFFACKEDEEAVLKKHCATRSHLKAFLRYKEDQNLRAEAERIQRRQKDKKDVKKEGGDKSEKDKDHENGEDNEEGGEDKLWEDVDKDLGDLLREVGPEGHEDDEEDGSVLNINIERFDRFKNSEKQKQKASENGTEGEEETSKKADTTEQPSPVKAKKEDAKTTAKTEEKAAADAK